MLPYNVAIVTLVSKIPYIIFKACCIYLKKNPLMKNFPIHKGNTVGVYHRHLDSMQHVLEISTVSSSGSRIIVITLPDGFFVVSAVVKIVELSVEVV
jgi:hypothetical protein